MQDFAHRHAAFGQPSSRLAAVIHAIGRFASLCAERRRLQRLPDYMLRDIGVSRCEIDRVTRYGRENR